jgi:hypothetical protein
VRRVDKRRVRQPQQPAVQRVVEHAGQLRSAPAERGAQIRAADVADEQRVAGEHGMWLVAVTIGVVDDDRDRLRRVTGGFQHLEAHRAERKRVPIAHRHEVVFGAGASAHADHGADAIAQLEVPGDEIGVEMGQEHVADTTAEPGGVLEVTLDVALRIDDHRCAAVLVGDQVRRMRQAAEVVLLQDRGGPSIRICAHGRRSLPP